MRAPPTHGSWSATTLRACPRRTSAGLAGSGSFHPHHTILKSFGPKISHPPPVGRTVLPSARNTSRKLTDLLFVDERRARRTATAAGLSVTGYVTRNRILDP